MRPRSLLSCAFTGVLVACLIGAAGKGAAQSTLGRVSGVVNDENNKPVKAATVAAENPDTNVTFTATTDDKGRFTILGLRPGTWRFVAAAPGYFAEQGSMPIRVGSPNSPIAFVLKKTGVPGGGALGSISAKELQADLAAAEALFTQGKWDEAVAAYRAIMEKAPSLNEINLQIGEAYINKKDYDAAIAAYGDLLKADPANGKATIGAAKARLAKGDRAGAEATLAKAAGEPQADREIFYSLADLKFDQGDTDEAMKWYRKAADTDPSWGKPWYKLGLAAQKKGDNNSAAQFLNKAIAVDPLSPDATMAKSTLDQLPR